MNGPSDYEDEMSDDVLADEAIEAFLLGLPHAAWEQDEVLAPLASHVATAVAAPPPAPNHALLQLFWIGEPGVRAEADARAPVTEPVAVLAATGATFVPRRWRRLLAGVAAGAATVTVSMGAAGATGVLPAPAQRVVARVVEAVSPFEIQHPREEGPSPSGRSEGSTVGGSGTRAPEPTHETAVTTPRPSGAATAPSTQSGTVPPVPDVARGPMGQGRAAETPAAGPLPPAVPEPPNAGAAPATRPGASTSPGIGRALETPAGTAGPPSPLAPPRAVPPAGP